MYISTMCINAARKYENLLLADSKSNKHNVYKHSVYMHNVYKHCTTSAMMRYGWQLQRLSGSIQLGKRQKSKKFARGIHFYCVIQFQILPLHKKVNI